MPLDDATPLASFRPGSLTFRLASLKIGKSEAAARRIDPDVPRKREMRGIIDEVRDIVSTAIFRIGKKTEFSYRFAPGSFRTGDHDAVVCVVAARMA